MARYPVTLRLFNCAELGSEGSLEQLLSTVHNAGFEIRGVNAGRRYHEVGDEDEEADSHIAVQYCGKVPDRLQVAYEQRRLRFTTAYMHPDNSTVGVNFFDIGWNPPGAANLREDWIVARAGFNEIFILKKKDPEYHARRFLQLGMDLYSITGPSFGYIEAVPHGSFRPLKYGHTTFEEVAKLRLPHIYWANFFGPDYVNHLGREFLAQAPGWKLQDLDDGGFLYVLSPSLSGAGPADVVRKVRSYFGVEHVRRRPRKRRKRKQ